VVEEQAQALLRTAFGAITREAGDLSAGVYDTRGNMLAQAVTGTPGHVNTMAAAVQAFLRPLSARIDAAGRRVRHERSMDGHGHLFDFVMVTPVFRDARPVALFASTCHTVDIGGVGFNAEARSVYEEGLCIPHQRLAQRGARSKSRSSRSSWRIRATRSRRAATCFRSSPATTSARARLVEMMREFDLEIDRRAGAPLSSTPRAPRRGTRSQAAARANIAARRCSTATNRRSS
jgi:N-methylhydantoinase B